MVCVKTISTKHQVVSFPRLDSKADNSVIISAKIQGFWNVDELSLKPTKNPRTKATKARTKAKALSRYVKINQPQLLTLIFTIFCGLTKFERPGTNK